MLNPLVSERIKQRVSETQRDYSPREQRVELLLRNQQFLDELWDMYERWHPAGEIPGVGEGTTEALFFNFRETLIERIKDGTLTKRDIDYLYVVFVRYKKLEGEDGFKTTDKHKAEFVSRLQSLEGRTTREISSWINKELIVGRRRGFYPDGPIWMIFCERWRINCDWDGYSKETLKDNVFASPRLISWNWQTYRYAEWWALPNNPLDDLVAGILIQVDPWTTKKDLENLGPAIAQAKKKIFGYSERETRNFGRDLCWYDLHTQDDFRRRSYGQIAGSWNAWGGRGSHKRGTIIQAVNRIKYYIDRLTPLS